MRALGKDNLFAFFGRVALDHANAAERFGQPAGDLGVDLAPLAKQRPQLAEGVRHAAAEQTQHDDGDDRQLPVEIKENADSDDRREDTADQLHEPGPHQVPDALGIAHDARQQHAGLRRIEVADWQPHDVRLDPFPHVSNGALRRHAEYLGIQERRDRLHRRCDAAGNGNRQQQLVAALGQHFVDDELG